MKRPLFWAACCIFAAFAVVFSVGKTPVLFAAAGIISAAGVFKKLGNKRAAQACFVCFCAAVSALVWAEGFRMLKIAPLREYDGRDVKVTGAVTAVSTSSKIPVYEVYGDISAGNRIFKGYDMSFADFGDTALTPGDYCELTVKLSVSDLSELFGSYNLSAGRFAGGYIKSATKTDRPARAVFGAAGAPAAFAARMKKSIYDLDRSLGGKILCALLLGDRSDIPDDFTMALGYSGLAHVVSVSGLHLGVIAIIFMRIFEHTYLPIKARYAVIIPIIWAAAALTGLGYPAVRAALMLTVRYLGLLFDLGGDTLGSLGFAGIIILLANPYAALSVSFGATFCAVAAIAVLAKPFEEFLKNLGGASAEVSDNKAVKYILSATALGAAAAVGTAPIIGPAFGYISLNSFVTGPVVIPLLPFILGVGYLATFFGALGFAGLARILFLPVRPLLAFFVFVAQKCAGLPAVVFADYFYIAALGGVWFAAACYLGHKNVPVRRCRAFCLAAAGVFVLGGAAERFTGAGRVGVISEDRFVFADRGGRAIAVGVPDKPERFIGVRERGVRTLDALVLVGEDFIKDRAAARFIELYNPEIIFCEQTPVALAYLSGVTDADIRPLPREIEFAGSLNVRIDGDGSVRIITRE